MNDYGLRNSLLMFSILLMTLPQAARTGLSLHLLFHYSVFGFQVEGWYLL